MNRLTLATALSAALISGCGSSNDPMNTVEYVDLDRFMGDWYVIANIPTFLEKNAHNALESYALNDDGTVSTTFTFRERGFEGPLKTYNPKGFVKDKTTNALWGMQFVWPIKADFRIVHLDDDYQSTIIGRQARDYVWVMAREPRISDKEYQALISKVGDLGYDLSKLQRVPQSWPEIMEKES